MSKKTEDEKTIKMITFNTVDYLRLKSTRRLRTYKYLNKLTCIDRNRYERRVSGIAFIRNVQSQMIGNLNQIS